MSSLTLIDWVRRFQRHARNDGRGGVLIRPRSLYILPTKQGLLLALILILMLAGAINYGSNLAYLITFLLGGLWLSAIFHTWRNLLGLRLAPAPVSPVFAGQHAVFSLYVTNPSTLDRYGIGLQHKKLVGSFTDLPAGVTTELQIPLPTRHRGHLTLPAVSLHTRYPFGLFHAWSYARLELDCLVYPAPATHGTPPTESCYSPSENGDRGVGADDFVGLRNYRQGDSPRHIDWKALARERGLLSKQFGGDRRERIELDWDLLPDGMDVETRLSQLCRFILQAEARSLSYGLKLPGLTIPQGQGDGHRHRCLSALAEFGMTTS